MKIRSLALLGAAIALITASTRAASTTAPADTIQPFLHDYFASNKKSCMVVGLIDANGSTVLAAGTLDNGSDHAPDGDTIFFIGSVSKTFTALLLADLAQHGDLSLDDPLTKYLPDAVKVPSFNGRTITLLDLATHAAALPVDPPNMVGPDTRAQYESYTSEQMETFLSAYTLPRAPGSQFSYSNVGMAILGHAMERKTGQPYDALIVNRIAKPLGMSSSCVTLRPDLEARLAIGHDKSGHSDRPWQLQAYAPAGGVHSTVSDLLKYAAAQAGLTSTPLDPAIATTHIIRHIDSHGIPEMPGIGTFGQTAMDWVDRGALQPPGSHFLGHAGGAGSYHAFVGFDTAQRRAVVVCSTDNDLSVEAVGWTLLQQKPLTAESAKNFEHEFVGIGVALALDNPTKILIVTKVFPNSPAADAGLTSGILIRKIGDAPTAGKSLQECAKLLRGAVGSQVHLEIVDASGHATVVDLTRRKFIAGS